MDKRTYKAARRSIIFSGLKWIADGLYGLRITLAEEDYLAEMLCTENILDVELEDEDEES
jgi:hypothetical protein